MRVLLVDDEIEFVNTLSNRLGMRGIKADVVHDGTEALDYVKKQEPDVMIVDLKMPGLQGMEVLRQVKKTNPEIEVVILTGHGTDRDEEEARRLKAFDYLTKPTDGDALAERIRAAHRHKVRRKGREKMQVLLVDDEIEFVTTLSNRLGMRGIKTNVVHDGDQALDYVKEQEPDVIVLDLKMPGLHGMEVLRRLSKTNPDIQVVVLTGHGTDRDEEEARRLKAFDYLRKPTDVDILADRIRGAYRYKMEKMMAAVAFAEAGEFDTARDIAKEAESFKTTGEMFKDEK